MPFAILWPTFALVALVFVVWFWLFFARMGHLRRTPPGHDTFATGESSLRYFQPVEMPANNLKNLFEMPVLYFALVPLLLITRHADHAQVFLAWLFVVSRIAHSLAHILIKDVRLRASVYWLGTAFLMAMWIGFFIDMVSAASAYHAAMKGMPG